MKLEEFDRRWIISVGAQPTVAITKTGTFALNRAAYEALGRAQAVKLLYGTEERVIGLRPTKNSPKAYPVKSYTKGKTYHVSGSKFCNFYEVLPEERRRYPVEVDGDTLLLHLDQQVHRTPQRDSQPRRFPARSGTADF